MLPTTSCIIVSRPASLQELASGATGLGLTALTFLRDPEDVRRARIFLWNHVLQTSDIPQFPMADFGLSPDRVRIGFSDASGGMGDPVYFRRPEIFAAIHPRIGYPEIVLRPILGHSREPEPSFGTWLYDIHSSSRHCEETHDFFV